jgi:hypothetical protein
MGLTGNFGQLALDAKGFLTVTGVSSGLDGYELVSRDVAVHQNTFVTHGAAKNDVGSTSWATHPPLAAAEFQAAADALAVGFETYFTAGNDQLPAFVTFTWSQIIPITQG